MAIIKHSNNALANVTAFPSAVSTGKPVLISTATASSSASIEFTSGIDSTYDIYQFEFVNIHPSSDAAEFEFQGSTDGGSNYNTTITSTHFRTVHDEANTTTLLTYFTSGDQAQGTSFERLSQDTGSDNDQCCVGTLNLFNPSSTTFVKHFIGIIQNIAATNFSTNEFKSGYFNTTSAINAVKFKFASANIDAGTIKMYGISA